MRLAWRVLGDLLFLPIWALLIVGMLPCMFIITLSYSFLFGDWNWIRMWRESRQIDRHPYTILPCRMREMDEREAEFARLVARYFAQRRRKRETVNWMRDGF